MEKRAEEDEEKPAEAARRKEKKSLLRRCYHAVYHWIDALAGRKVVLFYAFFTTCAWIANIAYVYWFPSTLDVGWERYTIRVCAFILSLSTILSLLGVVGAAMRSQRLVKIYFFCMPAEVILSIGNTVQMACLKCCCCKYSQCSALKSFAKFNGKDFVIPFPVPDDNTKYSEIATFPWRPLPEPQIPIKDAASLEETMLSESRVDSKSGHVHILRPSGRLAKAKLSTLLPGPSTLLPDESAHSIYSTTFPSTLMDEEQGTYTTEPGNGAQAKCRAPSSSLQEVIVQSNLTGIAAVARKRNVSFKQREVVVKSKSSGIAAVARERNVSIKHHLNSNPPEDVRRLYTFGPLKNAFENKEHPPKCTRSLGKRGSSDLKQEQEDFKAKVLACRRDNHKAEATRCPVQLQQALRNCVENDSCGAVHIRIAETDNNTDNDDGSGDYSATNTHDDYYATRQKVGLDQNGTPPNKQTNDDYYATGHKVDQNSTPANKQTDDDYYGTGHKVDQNSTPPNKQTNDDYYGTGHKVDQNSTPPNKQTDDDYYATVHMVDQNGTPSNKQTNDDYYATGHKVDQNGTPPNKQTDDDYYGTGHKVDQNSTPSNKQTSDDYYAEHKAIVGQKEKEWTWTVMTCFLTHPVTMVRREKDDYYYPNTDTRDANDTDTAWDQANPLELYFERDMSQKTLGGEMSSGTLVDPRKPLGAMVDPLKQAITSLDPLSTQNNVPSPFRERIISSRTTMVDPVKQAKMSWDQWIEYMLELKKSGCHCMTMSNSCAAYKENGNSAHIRYWCKIEAQNKELCQKNKLPGGAPLAITLYKMPIQNGHQDVKLLWSKDLCTTKGDTGRDVSAAREAVVKSGNMQQPMCKCVKGMGFKVRGADLTNVRKKIVDAAFNKEEVLIGYRCNKWYEEDTRKWCVVGFDSACADKKVQWISNGQGIKVFTSSIPCQRNQLPMIIDKAADLCQTISLIWLTVDVIRYALFPVMFALVYFWIKQNCSTITPEVISEVGWSLEDPLADPLAQNDGEELKDKDGWDSEYSDYSYSGSADEAKQEKQSKKDKPKKSDS